MPNRFPAFFTGIHKAIFIFSDLVKLSQGEATLTLRADLILFHVEPIFGHAPACFRSAGVLSIGYQNVESFR